MSQQSKLKMMSQQESALGLNLHVLATHNIPTYPKVKNIVYAGAITIMAKHKNYPKAPSINQK